MRLGSLLLFAPVLLTGCVVPEPEPEAEPVQDEVVEAEQIDDADAVGQGMRVLPGDRAMTADQRDACTKAGGTVERRGMAQTEVCVTPYADAGKICTDGDQCTGRCIAEGRVGSAPGETVTGICQRDDQLFGCYGIVEDGRIEAGLCVD